MVRVAYLAQVQDDFERIIGHLVDHSVADAAGRIESIKSAIAILQDHPLIGRPAAGTLQRELVIGRGLGGCVALYRYAPEAAVVTIHAIRAQKESGYAR